MKKWQLKNYRKQKGDLGRNRNSSKAGMYSLDDAQV